MDQLQITRQRSFLSVRRSLSPAVAKHKLFSDEIQQDFSRLRPRAKSFGLYMVDKDRRSSKSSYMPRSKSVYGVQSKKLKNGRKEAKEIDTIEKTDNAAPVKIFRRARSTIRAQRPFKNWKLTPPPRTMLPQYRTTETYRELRYTSLQQKDVYMGGGWTLKKSRIIPRRDSTLRTPRFDQGKVERNSVR